jgi:hypothetical protein
LSVNTPPEFFLIKINSIINNNAGFSCYNEDNHNNYQITYNNKGFNVNLNCNIITDKSNEMFMGNKKESLNLVLFNNKKYSLNIQKGILTKLSRDIIQMTSFQRSLIIGLILSDG